MRRVYVAFAGLMLFTAFIFGCSVYKSLFEELPLSENYALKARGATSRTEEIIDGDRETGAGTTFLPAIRMDSIAEDSYTGVEVVLPEVKYIDRIVIYNEKLLRYELKAHDPNTDEWFLVRDEKRNMSGVITIHPRGGIETDKIRLMVRRTVKTSGGTAGGGGGGKGGGFFLDENPIIKEIELYKILKEEPAEKKEEKTE